MTPPADQFVLPAGLPPSPRKRVKVLSLSGGGYRGLFTAAVIEALEKQLSPDAQQLTPFGQHFDLIAGTSIGGILATALSAGVKGCDLRAVLEDRGSTIFPAMRWRVLRKVLGNAPYKPERLRSAILAVLPDAEKKLLSGHRPALLLTSVQWTTSKLHLLGSAGTPHQDILGLSLMDAMLATSAAPAHFPPHAFGPHRFVDGGLAANAPDVHALKCARRMFPDADIQMLSIGTANPLHGRDPSALPARGLSWARPVIELVMNAQEMLAVQECEATMGRSYVRLNTPPSTAQSPRMDFDVADAVSTQLLLTLARDCLHSLSPQQRNALAAVIR